MADFEIKAGDDSPILRGTLTDSDHRLLLWAATCADQVQTLPSKLFPDGSGGRERSLVISLGWVAAT